MSERERKREIKCVWERVKRMRCFVDNSNANTDINKSVGKNRDKSMNENKSALRSRSLT